MTDPVRAQDLRALLASIESAGWDYARIELDDLTLVVSDGAEVTEPAPTDAPTAATAPPATTPANGPLPEAAAIPEFATTDASVTAAPEHHGARETVVSPSIGLFWRSPKPGAPPFVEVGQQVAADDTVCIIEVMKLMTHVKAGQDGVIVHIHAANGDTVEFGTPLIDIASA